MSSIIKAGLRILISRFVEKLTSTTRAYNEFVIQEQKFGLSHHNRECQMLFIHNCGRGSMNAKKIA